ncbi:protein NDUFAF4 homolog [Daktulosphaira vitifoliae]|uniref:protein NDUFAF4 homolog n=1 Tax=Daktulosphaira vitifoliae TaxID=58002 RepID=UPI0021AA5B21|nr:protein NDUFAF4 homolog [Daktulosphaira vitifoliae]
MGLVGSHLSRKIRRFNVIDRTERIINKEKPIPAPLHKTDVERLKKMMQDDPQMKEEVINKNSLLEKNLKDVYVNSTGDHPDNYVKTKAKLPQNREQVFSYGFFMKEPSEVPEGRYTLSQIVECISDHHKDKKQFTAEILAKKLKIDVKVMENILNYYRVFDMYIPQNMRDKPKSKAQQFISSTFDGIKKDLMHDKNEKQYKYLEK